MWTPELAAAWAHWKAADDAVNLLMLQGGGGDREAFFAAMQAAVDAGEKLRAARRRALS